MDKKELDDFLRTAPISNTTRKKLLGHYDDSTATRQRGTGSAHESRETVDAL